MSKIDKSNIDLNNLSTDLMTYGMNIIGNLKDFDDLDDIHSMAISLGYYYAIINKNLYSTNLKKDRIKEIIKDSMYQIISVVAKKEGYEKFEYKILESYSNCYNYLKRKKTKNNQIKFLSKLYLKDLYDNEINDNSKEKSANNNLLDMYNNAHKFINENIKHQKPFNDIFLKSAVWIIFAQVLTYLFCLITNNFNFNLNSGLDILKFVGLNLLLIIAVIFLIKSRNNLRYIFNIKTTKVGTILIVVFTIATLIIGLSNITIGKIDMNKIDEMVFGPKCENGFDYVDNKCVKEVTVNSNIVYECSLSTYQLEGNQCVRYYNAGYFDECPTGYLSWLGYCKKIGASTNYSKCGSGSSYYYFDDMCYPNLPITRKYYCTSGMLLGDKCRQTTPALTKYECPLGYDLNIIDKTCMKTIVETPLR